jgi:hypothetical protein
MPVMWEILLEVVDAFSRPARATKNARRRKKELADLLQERLRQAIAQATIVKTADGRQFQFTGEWRPIRSGDFHFCAGELRYASDVPSGWIHPCFILRDMAGDYKPPPRPSPAADREARIAAALRTLELPRESTSEEIRQAFWKLARKFHPDVPETGDTEKMAKLSFAFGELKELGLVE